MKRVFTLVTVLLSMMVLIAHSEDKLATGKTLLKEGKICQAIAMLSKVVEQSPRNIEALQWLGKAYLQAGKPDSAEIMGNNILLVDGKNVEGYRLVLKAQTMQKKIAEAYATYRKGSKDTKNNPALLIELGYLHLVADSVHKAEVAFSRALQSLPKDPDIYRGLGEVYEKMGAEPVAMMKYEQSLEYDSVQVDLRMKLASMYLKERRYNDAAKMYMAILNHDPGNDTAALEIGKIFTLSKQYASAVYYLEPYVMRHPEDTQVWAIYMVNLDKSRQYESALKAAEHLLKSDPNNTKALSLAGKANFMKKEYDKALEYYLKLEKIDTLSFEDAKYMGKAYILQKNDSLGVHYLQKSADMNPEQTDVYSDLGSAYMRLKKYDKAAEMFERKIQQDSTYATGLVNLSLCRMALQQWDKSYQAIKKAIALRPTYAAGYIYLARTLSQMDSLKAARNAYLTATVVADSLGETEKYTNEMGEAFRYITFTYLVDKNYPPALDAVTKAVQFRPTDVELHLWRAQILHALDKREEAKRQYQKVLQLDPNNKDAKKGLDLLELYN